MPTTDRFKKKVLGIAVEPRALVVAEIACANGAGSARVCRTAQFHYPAGLGLEQGEALGRAFAQFLVKEQFSARRAILGVPAKWLILKTHSLPPADPATAASMLALHAESASPPELGEMIFDCATQASELAPTTHLLVGLAAQTRDRLTTLATTAGLKLTAITSTIEALGAATARAAGPAVTLSISPAGAELASNDATQTRDIRHVNSTPTSLVAELRRTTATLPAVAAQQLIIWDNPKLSDEDLDAIRNAVAIPITRGELSSLTTTNSSKDSAAIPAIALALSASQRPSLNFLSPRLVRPKTQTVRRRTLWISAAAAAVLIVGGVVYADLSRISRKIAAVDADLQQLAPRLKVAAPFVANTASAETFITGNPRSLKCLCDITAALPEGGQTHLTSFHLQTTMKGEFAGRANSEQEVLNLLDKLHALKQFADLNCRTDGRSTNNGGNAGGANTSAAVPAAAAMPPTAAAAPPPPNPNAPPMPASAAPPPNAMPPNAKMPPNAAVPNAPSPNAAAAAGPNANAPAKPATTVLFSVTFTYIPKT